MSVLIRVALFVLVLAGPAFGQAVAALSPEQIENFLRTAKITSTRDAGDGITNSKRVTMTNGTLTHDAHVQTIDIQKPIVEFSKGPPELNFRDSYRYNIAGYRLARMLGMTNVPVSIERRISGRDAAVTWWTDEVLFDERTRLNLPEGKREGPNPERTELQLSMMRVFDELIQNRDRNRGNIIWTKDWKMWLIDHTRAFRLGNELLAPQVVQRCERTMCEKMRTLTLEGMTKEMGSSMNKDEINALLKRRDAILKLIDDRIGRRGTEVVLFTLPS